MSKFGFFDSLEEQRAYMHPKLKRLFPGFRSGGALFRQEIATYCQPITTILDAGSGATGIVAESRSQAKRIIGVDSDIEAGRNNRGIDEFLPGNLESIPLPDASVELVTSEFVVEHLERPDVVFNEIFRVLKPGGTFIFLTSNVLNPVMAISKYTPQVFHDTLRKKLLHKSEHAHTTWYRANSINRIQRLTKNSGLTVSRLQRAGNPEYLSFWKPLVVPTILLERLVTLPLLRETQMYIVATLKKSE